MKEYSVCYDKFCIGKFKVSFNEDDSIIPFNEQGAFEIYLLNLWNDGVVVTLKLYNEEADELYFLLLFPDGSEQLMSYHRESGYTLFPYKAAGKGRMAYLLHFNKGFEYKGFRGYEEYDEEEKLIIGVTSVQDETLIYSGTHLQAVWEDFEQTIDTYLMKNE